MDDCSRQWELYQPHLLCGKLDVSRNQDIFLLLYSFIISSIINILFVILFYYFSLKILESRKVKMMITLNYL